MGNNTTLQLEETEIQVNFPWVLGSGIWDASPGLPARKAMFFLYILVSVCVSPKEVRAAMVMRRGWMLSEEEDLQFLGLRFLQRIFLSSKLMLFMEQ